MDLLALHVTFSPMELFFMGLCVLLLLFSRPLLGRIFSEEDEKKFRGRLNLFRLACIMALILLLSGGVARSEAESPWFARLLGLLLVVYSAYLVFYLLSRLILRRFGRERQRNEQTVYVETYSSRLLTIIAGVVIVVVTLVAIIRILGYSTLLEAGGVLGVLGVMLALTQGSWVPDLVGGLVILNSRLIEEGDVIQIGSDPGGIAMVFRTKMFFTEFLHLANNHRILIQNSRLRGMTVHNLSRFASARGLRESLVIKVSYEVTEPQVQALFEQVMSEAVEDPDIAVEEKYEPEIRALEAGDYAVKWACFYYTKDARQVLKTRQLMVALLLRVAREQGVSLSTPMLVDTGERVAGNGLESALHPGGEEPESIAARHGERSEGG